MPPPSPCRSPICPVPNSEKVFHAPCPTLDGRPGPGRRPPGRHVGPRPGHHLYTYRDDDGPGRLTVRDLGAAAGVEGGRQIQVVLEQGGRRYEGAGIKYQIQQGPPARTLLVFSITSPTGAYFFQGATRVGIVPGADGQGVYYRASSPQPKYEWRIKERVR
jgi:hypothetical protein